MAYQPTGNPVGRPRTKIEDLPTDWAEIMRECGQDGGSAAECRCLLGIDRSAWNTLLEDSEDFRAAEKIREEMCEVWWEITGRKMSVGAIQGNSATWIFNMKNRFGWRDKIDHTTNDKDIAPTFGTLYGAQKKDGDTKP